jgi:F-type H+-transporting ATPase subunit delta
VIEALRGYAAAVLGRAEATDQARRVAAELPVFAEALFGDEQLRAALTDDALPTATRRAVVEDLLRQADPGTVRLVRYAVDHDRPAELPADVDWLARRAERAAAEDGGSQDLSDLEPVAVRAAARERLAGFAAALFEDVPERAVIEEVEDELFRFARMVEAEEPLRLALARQDLPFPLRQAVVSDLLSGRAQDATVRLATYAVAAGQGRGLVEVLDWLVDQAAAERGLRVAEVCTAADLDEDQRQRLAAALRGMTGREVELRVSVDPSLLGGAMVTVGDTVIDGTVRHRLDQLRQDLNSGAGGPAATGGNR